MKVLSSPHILALSSKSESFLCQTFTDNNIRMAEQEREASIRLRGLIGRSVFMVFIEWYLWQHNDDDDFHDKNMNIEQQWWGWLSAAPCRTQAKTWGSKRTMCSSRSPIGLASIIIWSKKDQDKKNVHTAGCMEGFELKQKKKTLSVKYYHPAPGLVFY